MTPILLCKQYILLGTLMFADSLLSHSLSTNCFPTSRIRFSKKNQSYSIAKLYSLLPKDHVIAGDERNDVLDDKSTRSDLDLEWQQLSGSPNEDTDDLLLITMTVLIFTVGSLSSLDRVAMSVALVPMSEEMLFSDTIKGSISSFFSLGYGFGILPAGLLLSKLSPRNIMGVGIGLWSLGTIATPFSAAQTNMNLLLGARMLVGASESVVIPTIQRLLSKWVPADKKSLAVGIVFCGFQIGTILAYSLSPAIIDRFEDWRIVFYIYGAAGLLFLIPWLVFAQDSPPDKSGSEAAIPVEEELALLTGNDSAGNVSSVFDKAKNILLSAPWKQFSSSKATWAMFLAHASNNWSLYNSLSWSPTFYAEQYGLNVKESAIFLILPSIAGIAGGLSAGSIADSIIQNTEATAVEARTRIRRRFQGLALFGPAVCLTVLASNIPEQPWVAQALFAVAVGMQAFNSAGYGAANQEKAGPKWTGLLYSITSLPSVAVGTLGVYLTGRILDATDQNWSYVFSLNAVINLLGALAFVMLYDSRREFD